MSFLKPPSPDDGSQSLIRRLGWIVGLWAAGVAVVIAAGWVLLKILEG